MLLCPLRPPLNKDGGGGNGGGSDGVVAGE